MPTWRTPQLRKLAKTLCEIDNTKEMLTFLRDLCTVEELESISKRWLVVQLLEKGMTYRKIAEKTGMSTATITRIAHWYKHGEGGFKAGLKK